MFSRKLTDNEIKLLQSIYFNEVDFTKVRITKKHLFSFLLRKFSGITFGNKIIFTKKSYRLDFSETISDSALLVHEICHVWQYQNTNYWWFKAMLEHIKFGKDVYKYELTENKYFNNYRYEQQGEIMADYYRNIAYNNLEMIGKYKNVIDNFDKIRV